MKIKHMISGKSNSEKLLQCSQIALNLAVILALSPLVYTALEDAYRKASGWPERLRNAVWDYLSGGSV